MSIKPQQIKLVHIYKTAARLDDKTYRNILRDRAGVSSTTHHGMDQAGFEAVMAALETKLFIRVAAGQAVNPIGKSRHIRCEDYWRSRLPANGFATSRQLHRINQLWDNLAPHLPGSQQSLTYLAGVIRKATGRDVPYATLMDTEAASLIDALSDRLDYAEQLAKASQPQQLNLLLPKEFPA